MKQNSESADALGLEAVMTKEINKLPNIILSDISGDVTKLLEANKVIFKPMEEAPWWIRKFSNIYSEYYLAYKNTLYVAVGHVAIATSKNPTDRIIATSKLLPWVYAIKNGSVSSLFKFLQTMFSIEVRSYYFLFEFAMLKAHELPEIPELIATGFLSSRKNALGMKRNPEKIALILKRLIRDKIERTN